MKQVLLSIALILMAVASVADPATLAAINAERAAQNRAPLVYNTKLEAVARRMPKTWCVLDSLRMQDRMDLTLVNGWIVLGIDTALARKTLPRANAVCPR